MAGLNIAEKRLPQDGRIRIRLAGKDIDIRVSIVPTAFGERVVMRLLDKATTVLQLEELGLIGMKLDLVHKLIKQSHGILLVTGPTGSGKTTTLYAALSKINTNDKNIITIEDPIEYMHHHKRSIVNQREVRADTHSFCDALKHVLRQDPDVILIGEMRDLETIAAALTIAETGHLTLATLHTNSTYESINRIVDVFPEHQQSQVLAQLAFTLEGVITQQLLPKLGGAGRVLASEVLVCTPAIKALIREKKVHQIYSLMQAGQKFGMQTMNQSLYRLYTTRQISLEEAMGRTSDLNEFETMLARGRSLSGTGEKERSLSR
jgi:twitching motility protein PilT